MAEQADAVAGPKDLSLASRIGQRVDSFGFSRTIFLPITGLAAISGAIAIFGDAWLLGVAVLGVCTSILAIALLVIEGHRRRELSSEVASQSAKTKTLLSEMREQIEGQQRDLEILALVTERARWATQQLGTCYLARSHTTEPESPSSISEGGPGLGTLSQSNRFRLLIHAVTDCVQEILQGQEYRGCVYLGNEAQLTPEHPIRWMGDPPTLSADGSPQTREFLRDLRKNGIGLYVEDVDHPNDHERPFLEIIPNRERYKFFACYAIGTTSLNGAPGSYDLCGALLVQVAAPGALVRDFERNYCAILANTLAVGYRAAGPPVIEA